MGWTVNLTAAAVTAEAVQQLRLAAGALGALSIADLASPCVLTPLRGARLDALDGGASRCAVSAHVSPLWSQQPRQPSRSLAGYTRDTKKDMRGVESRRVETLRRALPLPLALSLRSPPSTAPSPPC